MIKTPYLFHCSHKKVFCHFKFYAGTQYTTMKQKQRGWQKAVITSFLIKSSTLGSRQLSLGMSSTGKWYFFTSSAISFTTNSLSVADAILLWQMGAFIDSTMMVYFFVLPFRQTGISDTDGQTSCFFAVSANFKLSLQVLMSTPCLRISYQTMKYPFHERQLCFVNFSLLPGPEPSAQQATSTFVFVVTSAMYDIWLASSVPTWRRVSFNKYKWQYDCGDPFDYVNRIHSSVEPKVF